MEGLVSRAIQQGRIIMLNTRTSFLTSLALLLGLGASASAQDSYVRIQQGDGPSDAALQCAVGSFRSADRDVEVILYGVVHVADAEYYATVQRDLDSYTSVLYEGVAPGTEEPTESDRALGDLQQLMGDMLGLQFQKDGIDYTRSNLVHADMNMDQLKEALGGGSINPMGQFMSEEQLEQMAPMLRMAANFGKMMMESNPGMRDQLKMQFANQLGNADLGSALGDQMTQVILIDRNEVAFNVLLEQLETQQSGTIAIFYGAAHMPDLENRLAEIGFGLTSKRWMSAWQIGNGVPSDAAPAAGCCPEDGACEGCEGEAPAAAPQSTPAQPADGSRWFK
jgi:hypothetical protein